MRLVFANILIAAHCVIAGHGMFEPKIGAAQSQFMPISGQLASMATANTTHHWTPRAVKIKSGKESKIWPDKTIPYCFKNDESRDRLQVALNQGMDTWHNNGLSKDFKLEPASRDRCENDRENVLEITYDPGSRMSTTNGKTPPGLISDGPSMTLSDDDSRGMLNFILNVAHEIGHAWGLLHEHQNPDLWPEEFGGNGGKTFGDEGNWVCSALLDYKDTLKKIQDKIDKDPTGGGEAMYGSQRVTMCTDIRVARDLRFSARDYLPLQGEHFTVGTTTGTEVDWDSIMLYPSGAGGKRDSEGKRMAALKKPNGDLIKVNTTPSQRDIDALNALYGTEKKVDETLLGKNKKFGGRFRNVFGGRKC